MYYSYKRTSHDVGFLLGILPYMKATMFQPTRVLGESLGNRCVMQRDVGT